MPADNVVQPHGLGKGKDRVWGCGLTSVQDRFDGESCEKMIKEDNSGDTNKPLYSMKWAASVSKGPENWRMAWKAGSFYRIKSRDQGSKYRVQSWLGRWGLADWKYRVSGQADHLKGHDTQSKFQFADVAPRQKWLHLGPRHLFQQLEF